MTVLSSRRCFSYQVTVVVSFVILMIGLKGFGCMGSFSASEM